jgi:hypothetical protein
MLACSRAFLLNAILLDVKYHCTRQLGIELHIVRRQFKLRFGEVVRLEDRGQ